MHQHARFVSSQSLPLFFCTRKHYHFVNTQNTNGMKVKKKSPILHKTLGDVMYFTQTKQPLKSSIAIIHTHGIQII